jgi:predicted GTPase
MRDTVMLVDLPGLDESTATASELLAQAERADLVMWVASATQPARDPDRKRLDDFRAWANAQLVRRVRPASRSRRARLASPDRKKRIRRCTRASTRIGISSRIRSNRSSPRRGCWRC